MEMTITDAQRAQRINTFEAEDHSEGVVARTLEQQTAKLPSDLWLWAAASAVGASLAYRLNGHRERSLFVGQWVAPFLLIGLYNKIVKVAGSDRIDR